MRNEPNVKAERYRISGPPRTNCGAFEITGGKAVLRVMVSDAAGWDHVSVSTSHRVPDWDEMCLVKRLFFKDDEVAFQLHPAEKEYVNTNPFVLHLWRPQTQAEVEDAVRRWGKDWKYGEPKSPGEIPLPPSIMVGPRDMRTLRQEVRSFLQSFQEGPPRYFVRLGDAANYYDFPKLQDLMEFIKEEGKPASKLVRHCKYGVRCDNYQGNNYISLYHGTSVSNPGRDLTESELIEINLALGFKQGE